jgi:hypothetical protein
MAASKWPTRPGTCPASGDGRFTIADIASFATRGGTVLIADEDE